MNEIIEILAANWQKHIRQVGARYTKDKKPNGIILRFADGKEQEFDVPSKGQNDFNQKWSQAKAWWTIEWKRNG